MENKELETQDTVMTPDVYRKTFWRTFPLQACFCFERMQNVGFAYMMIPALKKLYKNKKDISDALKIIIENTQPSPNAPQGTGFTDAGKNNKLVVKKLISVILDDTEYEIACTMNYLKYLEEQIKRLKNIEHLITKMNSVKRQEDIDFYKDYIPGFFKNNESFDNFDQIFQEYNDAYASKKKAVDDLFSEIKKIKKLKV